MLISEENYLMHYGILRKSGRYPWGSGGPEYASNKSFLGYVEQMRNQGLSETEIAQGFGVTTTQLRAAKTVAKNAEKQEQIRQATKLKFDKGYSNVAIGERMGLPESTVRSLLAPGTKDRNDILNATTDMLRGQINDKQYLDVGAGVENHLGISDQKLKTAIYMLREEGYGYHRVQILQVGTGKYTTVKVMTPPDVHTRDVYKNQDKIQQIKDFSNDGGHTYGVSQPPISISSKRLGINYAEDGGSKADGVIYVRPGKEDITLGKSNYAQVRIAIDGTHYVKGMAMYKNDLPDGIDLVFNTNKSNTGNKLDALKPMKDDPTNPFGAITRQLPKLDANGHEIKNTVRSAMNVVNEEGDWETWSRSLSSQFLSKQSPVLAKTQLSMDFERRKTELDAINSLTNPTIKKKLLDEYADNADSAAAHLKAAALPRQSTRVILPIDSLKDNEVYAPTYRNGERVVLVRHPHGGPFEIPELVVNNRQREAKSLLGNAADAIGINSRVAERLSGADFDGDQVLVIPNNSNKVRTAGALEGLKNFDPKRDYKLPDDAVAIKDSRKQNEMGNISNLITDMTIKGASGNELAAAVRHSMVVIDAEKHRLDIKASYDDNNIRTLKEKYQARPDGSAGGSSTLISRAGSEIRVPKRKQGFTTDPVTGAKIYRETGETYTKTTVSKRTGAVKEEVKVSTEKSTKLAEASDAHDLVSSGGGTPIEKIYADYSNSVKGLANDARLSSLRTQTIPYSPSAKVTYSAEVKQLNADLNRALQNRPRERQAQVIANATIAAKKDANPLLADDKEQLRKVRAQALIDARARVGAKKIPVEISDRQWEAIQAGAVSNSKLKQILDNTDVQKVKERATPRAATVMTDTKLLRAKQMLSSGYTQAEIADALGVSATTLNSSLKRGED